MHSKQDNHLLDILRRCVEAMQMQEGRKSGDWHINQRTARCIWDKALTPARNAIAPHDLVEQIRTCVTAMDIQLRSERGEIPEPVALRSLQGAIGSASAALTYFDERANDQVIDLDAEAWSALKSAIDNSPRFQEMYQAGGNFTDAYASVTIWLNETDHPHTSPASGL